MERVLQEFRIRGVKTNIPFLLNLITHPDFLAGTVTTRFLDDTPALFEFVARQDRASKLLSYIAEISVNGHPEVKPELKPTVALKPAEPVQTPRDPSPLPKGTRDKLLELGPVKFAEWVRAETRLLVTDTTMRDAHQSLLATRMRTADMLAVAPEYARRHADLFSLEMWGGATFDTSMRFLKEDPFDRLARLREKIPNILFQMLLRAASAVGYTNYPDNVVDAFVKESKDAGMDLFRVFDANNWLPNLKVGVDAVLESRRRRRGVYLLHRRHPRPESATSTRSTTSCRSPKTSSNSARTSYASRTWPGCSSPTRPRSWSRRSATRSACRSTSTRTTPPAGNSRRTCSRRRRASTWSIAPSPRSRAAPPSRRSTASRRRCGSPSGTPS